MKKIKVLIGLLVMGLLVTRECVVAQAAESGLTVTSNGVQVRELSHAEMEALSSDLSFDILEGDVSEPMVTTASYTAYEYTESFNFSLEGTWVARADARCIVWHYTDGKVHLYQRTITMTRLASFDADRTYGRIVNTDGSLSYTEGDRVTIIDYDDFWDFAIDFRVTPTEASFNCYEV